ncbi:MAG: phospholipid carrier-dependent glycosyltransferase [Alphaproteobacteria bacterium]|nr:phospholipid carrier-dependent glycosyltransferase [Alphaproteobacteria bacterium]
MLFAQPTDPAQARAMWIRDLAVLAVLIGGFFLLFLGHRPLAVPSEARYAELGREMIHSGDWITPRINGIKYFEKPPLFYWVQAAATGLFGMSEFALRLATTLFAVAGSLLAYVVGRKLFDRSTGIVSCAVMSTMLLWFALSRIILLDVPVGVFLSLSLGAFLFAVRDPPESRARKFWIYTMYVAAAAATLTKGLIGIVFPGLVIGTWIVLTWNWRLLTQVRLVGGLLVFLLLTVPWHILVGLKSPEFFHFYFVHEHWDRFTTTVHGRTQPWWFFFAILFVGSFPWIGFVLQSIWRNLAGSIARSDEAKANLFLALWFWLILIFYSVSDSKLIPYVTPLLIPMAIFVGRFLVDAFADPDGETSLLPGFWIVAGFAGVLALAALVVGIAGSRIFGGEISNEIELVRPMMGWVCLGALVACIALVFTLRRRSMLMAFAITVVATGAFLLTVDTSMADFQPRSVKPLAEDLLKRLKPEDEVIAYRTYPQDLPVYLGRRISVVGWSGELDFGRAAEPATQAWMFDDEAELWRRWNADRTVYMILPTHFESTVRATAEPRYREIARTARHILAVNSAE